MYTYLLVMQNSVPKQNTIHMHLFMVFRIEISDFHEILIHYEKKKHTNPSSLEKLGADLKKNTKACDILSGMFSKTSNMNLLT